MRAPVLILLLSILVLAGCGADEEGPAPEDQVRATLQQYVRAVGAKDYDTLCDRLFAEELLAEIRSVDVACESALQRGFEDVERPSLQVRSVRVQGDTAQAVVRTDAANQPPSDDTIRLVRREDGWRIFALAS